MSIIRIITRAIIAVAILTLLILMLALLQGCSMFGYDTGTTEGVYKQTIDTYDTERGGLLTTVTTETSAKVKAPSDAKETGAMAVNAQGISVGGYSTWQVDSTMTNTGMFYIAAIALILGAAVAIYMKSYVFSGCLAGASAICMFAPSLIHYLGGFVSVLAGGLILIGIVYLIGKYAMGWTFKQNGLRAHRKLMTEGKSAEAIAALRAAVPSIDATLSKAHEIEKGKVL